MREAAHAAYGGPYGFDGAGAERDGQAMAGDGGRAGPPVPAAPPPRGRTAPADLPRLPLGGAPGGAVRGLIAELVAAVEAEPFPTTVSPDAARSLSDELRQTIVRLLSEGLEDKVIACRLGMSERTCQRHIAEIMRAAGAKSRFRAGYSLSSATLPAAGGGAGDGAGDGAGS
ncbi:helix-turn-helix transcriptional regulator [Streptomyces sp. NPDC050448]|uniref:helix-turn-helix transcriptional regulator n=1 Tax=Streptomyces sp. NPDC050448 TaxID=3155404 RepID=UPI0034385FFC